MNYFPSLLLFSFSLLSQFENGCKCRIFRRVQYTTTPDTQTPHPDQTRPQEAHPDQTPTQETAADAIPKGHHRPTPEAAEPPTTKRPDHKTPTRHPDKRQQERPRNDPNRPTEPPKAEPRHPDRTPANIVRNPIQPTRQPPALNSQERRKQAPRPPP